MDRSEASFEQWYRHLHPRLVVSLTAAFGNSDLAGDAADEAVARAFEDWDCVSSMDSADGWVYRVAFNVSRRSLRRKGIERRLLFRNRPEPEPGPAGEIWYLVEDLPERQRLAVVLRHVGHLSEVDIASVMGISRGGVSSTLRAAYKSLRLELTDESTSEEVTR